MISSRLSRRDSLLFVYGTLRPFVDIEMATWLQSSARHLGLATTLGRLYDLGVFARVDVAVQNPDGIEPNKFLLFQVEEARKYSFNLGIGAEYLSKVATPGRDLSGITGLTTDGSENASYTGDEYGGNFIAYGDMWSAKLTAGITGQF